MEKLAKQILTHYQKNKPTWSEDWLLKLVSLFFAIFLWYFVTGEDRVDMNVQVPVEIVNLPRSLVISNQFKNQLEVTVSGPRGMIRKISQQEITRTIDLSDATPGNVVIPNDLDSIKFPHGIQALRIQPKQIILLLDRMIHKEMPIKLVTTGKLPRDYELEEIILEPKALTISGPDAVIGNQQSIQTMPISLSDLTDNTIKQVSLDLRPEISNLIGEPVVTAKLKITEKVIHQDIFKIPIMVNGLASDQTAYLYPEKVKIRATIPQRVARGNTPYKELFTVAINVDSLLDGTHELPVEAKAFQKVIIEEVVPQTVKVEITIKDVEPTGNIDKKLPPDKIDSQE